MSRFQPQNKLRHPVPKTRAAPIFGIAICIGTILPAQATLDPALVGTWRSPVSGNSILVWKIEKNGMYEAWIENNNEIPHETGTVEAENGTWSMKRLSGPNAGKPDGGSYFVKSKQLIISGRSGRLVYSKPINVSQPKAAKRNGASKQVDSSKPRSGKPLSLTKSSPELHKAEGGSFTFDNSRENYGFPGKGDFASWKTSQSSNNRGLSLMNEEKFAEAASSFDTAIKLYPYDCAYFTNLSICYTQMHRFKEGELAARKAVELAPNNEGCWTNLTINLRKQSKLPEALASARTACQLKPKQYSCWINIGNVLFDMADYEASQAAYDRSLSLNPPESLSGEILRLRNRSAEYLKKKGSGK